MSLKLRYMAENNIELTPAPPPVSMWDRSHPRSLINILPEDFARKVEAIREQVPEWFDVDEYELYKTLRREQCQPTPTDNRLRLQLWMEYDNAQAKGRRMIAQNIVFGICHPTYLAASLVKSKSKIAWLLCPPASYTVVMEEALNIGNMRMRQILEVDPVDPVTGKLDIKLATLQDKIRDKIENRVKGAIAQTVKQMNLNVMATDRELASALIEGNESDLDRRIADLKRKEREALNLPIQPIQPIQKDDIIDAETV